MGRRTHTADDENDNHAPLQASDRPPQQQSNGVDEAAHGRPTSDANNVSAARNYEDDKGPLKAPYRPPPNRDTNGGHGGVIPGALVVAGIEEENVTGENVGSSPRQSSMANQLPDTTPHLTDEEQPTSTLDPSVSLPLPTGGTSIIVTMSTITGTTTEASAYSLPRLPSEGDIGTSEGAPFEAQLVPNIEEEIVERVQREVQEALQRVAVNAPTASKAPQILGLPRNAFYHIVLVVVAAGVGVGVGVRVGATSSPSSAAMSTQSPFPSEFPGLAPSVSATSSAALPSPILLPSKSPSWALSVSCLSWALVAHALGKDSKLFAYNSNLKPDFANGTFVDNPVSDTDNFQRIFPFTAPDYIKFETGNLAHLAIYNWTELCDVINARGSEFEANSDYLYSDDGAKSYERKRGSVLS